MSWMSQKPQKVRKKKPVNTQKSGRRQNCDHRSLKPERNFKAKLGANCKEKSATATLDIMATDNKKGAKIIPTGMRARISRRKFCTVSKDFKL